MVSRKARKQRVEGQPLATDPLAKSGSPIEPAFIAKPQDAPAYYGFPVLRDVTVEGFAFGKITDFEAEPCIEGDAFIVAPDNSRAGLVWQVTGESHFREVLPFEAGRWGVWDVAFPNPMTSCESARKNLESILPALKEKQQEWQSCRKTPSND